MFIKHDTFTGAPRVEDLRVALDAIKVTHTDRMKKIDSLRSEIMETLDHVCNLKIAEEKYLRSLGFIPPPPIDEDGSPTRNPHSTKAGLGLNSRSNAPSRLKNEKYEDYSDPTSLPLKRPSQQDVNIAMNRALDVLINEDSKARRYTHLIQNAFLIINMKRKEIEALVEEKDSVSKGMEREDA